MASPLPMGPQGGGWIAQPHSTAPMPPSNADDSGLQVRSMGLKVHYTFDKESQVNCLARWPQTLQVQTIPLDQNSWIGLVDLRLCLQAIAQCSPEIVGQREHDYAVYASDFSEPETPLVGQGMMSWALEHGYMEEQKMITGRVTKNLLAVFGGGVKETLEVRLKLTQVPRMARAEPAFQNSGHNADSQQNQMPRNAPTPTDTTEWNSFLQSNPNLGRSANVASVQSPPNYGPARPDGAFYPAAPDHRPISRPGSRPSSIPPPLQPMAQRSMNMMQQATSPAPDSQVQMIAPGDPPPPVQPAPPAKASRPSSRAARPKKPTGNPRGRPRRKPRVDAAEGHTSAAEEPATDADDGPKKKRAKTIKADYPVNGQIAAVPDSLRVAASTSGSLRAMRPNLTGADASNSSHLHEGPRAPTPVPQLSKPARKRAPARPKAPARRESLASFDGAPTPGSELSQLHGHLPMGDACSPTDSIAASQENYTPAESPANFGSSPPVPRSGAYLQSSPPASSPLLPPMPMAQHDSGFMSGGLDDLLDEEECPQTLPPQRPQSELPAPLPPPPKAAPRKRTNTRRKVDEPTGFRAVNPGPPELLPSSSLYNPPAAVLRQVEKANEGAEAPPSLKRANTEPVTQVITSRSATPGNSVPDAPPRVEEGADTNGINSAQFISTETEAPESSARPSTAPLETSAPPNSAPGPGPGPVEQLDPAHTEMPGTSASQIPPRQMARAASMSALPPIPASDPVSQLTLPPPPPAGAFSEAPCPPSDADVVAKSNANKNLVKKQTIKERLERAIESGQMPPFCQNCGAIETPTWRKMWTQDHEGVPEYCEYSEKPGHVTAIDILERDSEGAPSKFRLVKKALGPHEDKVMWTELLLCNPCGIWLAKFKSHRPPDRWEKDKSRLGAPRRKRESSNKGNGRTKKPRGQSESNVPLTSDAYLPTDTVEPGDTASPQDEEAALTQLEAIMERELQQAFRSGSNPEPDQKGAPKRAGDASTHSRGSGTAQSPITVDDHLGATRRLLFPSPRKEGVPKVLCEIDNNTPSKSSSAKSGSAKSGASGKENLKKNALATPALGKDEMKDLFGTPPARPTTPPPNASAHNGPFKTPTRQTPSHRPITRSISKSIRSVRSLPKSPSQLLQQTPSKTPSTNSKGRTPGRNLHPHFNLDYTNFETPFTATVQQLLSEAHDFTTGSPAQGLLDLGLQDMQGFGSDALPADFGSTVDFNNYLSTDMVMPSSPPVLGGIAGDHQSPFDTDFNFDSDPNMWAQFSEAIAGEDPDHTAE